MPRTWWASIFIPLLEATPDTTIPFSGTGQTVGLLEFDTFQTSDVSDYLDLIGASATQINQLSEKRLTAERQPAQINRKCSSTSMQ